MKAQPSSVRRLCLAVLPVALLAMATPALPQSSSRYVVEIVVFSNGGDAGALAGDAAVSPAGDISATSVETAKLGGAAGRLRATGGYKVLAHSAWSQGAAGWNSRRGVSAARLGNGIEGKVIVERGQYLHLGVDLTVDTGGRRYRINEVRRVKPDEIQYFDHPSVGVLAVVSGG